MPIEENIQEISKKPHLVILGAGATIATIPNGDKNGRKSSVMKNFIAELGLENYLEGIKLRTKSKNLEGIYSELFERDDFAEIRNKLEEEIRSYFSLLRLPDTPTIYDLLVLSLRGKDAIATFNWDPLLIEAYNRVCKITKDLPELIFLHGNVHAGACPENHRHGYVNKKCPDCNNIFEAVPLLYPIKNKDYANGYFLNNQWGKVKSYLNEAPIVTIFGYGAPKTDEEAMKLLKEGYGSNIRVMHQIEIINLESKTKLRSTWEHFYIYSHRHVEVYKSFFESRIAQFPRRSIEGNHKIINGWWGNSSFSLKHNYDSFDELKDDFNYTLKNDRDQNYNAL